MAHTYQSLPPSLVAYLREVATATNTAITAEIDRTISFRHNSFKALRDELIEDSKKPTAKNSRYPLIALIQPFEADVQSGRDGADVVCDIIICNLAKSETPADTRESVNYDTILRPIYAEFISQLQRHRLITFQGRYPKHSHVDVYHMGTSNGTKNGYDLPDVVDAIVIEGLTLHLEPDPCGETTTSVARLMYYNLVNSVSLAGTGGQGLTVSLLAATYLNYEFDIPAPAYICYMEHDNTNTVITIGHPLSYQFGSEISGTFYGNISCDDGITRAFISFMYVVESGVIVLITELITMQLQNFTLSIGDDYPDYPFDAVGYCEMSDAVIDSVRFDTDGGNVVSGSAITYDPPEDASPATLVTVSLPKPETYRDVGYTVFIGDGSLENKTYYKII